jgi:hypothetical protein
LHFKLDVLRGYVLEIKVHEPDERLRRLGGSAKLCLDVVNCDPALQRAMIYALGNDTVGGCTSRNELTEPGFELPTF